MEKRTGLTTWIIIFIIISAICLGIGFYKMFAYENRDLFFSTSDIHQAYGRVAERVWETTNAYVGSDAYNYIINANYTIGYFILSMFFGLTSVGLGIIKTIKRNSNA
jgi:hypothetical protein